MEFLEYFETAADQQSLEEMQKMHFKWRHWRMTPTHAEWFFRS